MYGVLFQIEALIIISENAYLPQFSFWIPRVLTEIYFVWIVLNHAKISLY